MPLLGCIADDFTGATDLGSQLVRGGLRCVQWVGLPEQAPDCSDVDAVVVALKSRSIPAPEAVRQSVAALKRLQKIGCKRFYFKYCSTFDSTPHGNIGPVAEALAAALGAKWTIFCPAFPENGRTVFQGHLFVGDRLLSESGMEHHPLNPMTDSNLVRVLQSQVKSRVGLIPLHVVSASALAIQTALAELATANTPLVIADAVSDAHLAEWAHAAADAPLVTGGSALGRFLAAEYRARGMVCAQPAAAWLPRREGYSAVLAGSCSAATQRQVTRFALRYSSLLLTAEQLERPTIVQEALNWALPKLPLGPVLIGTTAAPEAVVAMRAKLGASATERIEATLAAIASGLVDGGVRRLVVAGGETSGAVLQSLGVSALGIGAEIDPGVPWTQSLGERPLALALKSGNFGGEDIFLRALEMRT